MKVSENQKWTKYFAQIVNSTICLYNNIMVNRPNHFVFVYKCELNLIKDPKGDYIVKHQELSHPNDLEKTFLSTSVRSHRKSMVEEEHTLEEWYERLRKARNDRSEIENQEVDYPPIGKVQLVISEAMNLGKLQKNSLYFVRIRHLPYIMKTSTALVEKDQIDWKQSFFMPIYDTFFPIILEVVCRYNTGWIIENKSEEVIYTAEVLMSDIMTMDSEHILKRNLPLTYVDPQKKTRDDAYAKKNENLGPELRIKIKNLSSQNSLFHSPNRDYLEGFKIETEHFSKPLLKLGIVRIKRAITYIGFVIKDIKDIFRCKYPFFSYLCILILSHIILTIDPPGLIALLFLFLTLLCLYKNPKIEEIVKNFMNTYFFAEEYLNRDYRSPHVQTIEELIAKTDMQTDKWKFKIVDDDPILDQIRIAKKSIIVFTAILLKITAFIEKLKNIVTWHDPVRTIWFTAFSFLAYCVCAVLPFRFIILLSVWANFCEGFSFYKKRHIHNVEVARRSLHHLVKKFSPNYYSQVVDKPTQPWPSSNFDTFQKKMVKELGTKLRLNLPDDTLQTSKTPEDLILKLASCSKFLKFEKDPNEEPLINEVRETTPGDYASKFIHFIMNVPSDYYRVHHPRMIDLYVDWRKKPKCSVEAKNQSRKRSFEIALIVCFMTIYELHLFFNFLRSNI